MFNTKPNAPTTVSSTAIARPAGTTDDTPSTQAAATELEAMMNSVEGSLAALGEALRLRDSGSIEDHARSLRDALEAAVDGFSRAARAGNVPASLRSRLMMASGQVAAQRESLVRATVALDSAIDVLLPRDTPVVYGGHSQLGPKMYSR